MLLSRIVETIEAVRNRCIIGGAEYASSTVFLKYVLNTDVAPDRTFVELLYVVLSSIRVQRSYIPFAWDFSSTRQFWHAFKAKVFRVARNTNFFAIFGASDCHHMVLLSVRIFHIFRILSQQHHGSIMAASRQHQGKVQLKVHKS